MMGSGNFTRSGLSFVAAIALATGFGLVQSALPAGTANAECVDGYQQGGYDPASCGDAQTAAPAPVGGSALSACEQNQAVDAYTDAGANTIGNYAFDCPGAPGQGNVGPGSAGSAPQEACAISQEMSQEMPCPTP